MVGDMFTVASFIISLLGKGRLWWLMFFCDLWLKKAEGGMEQINRNQVLPVCWRASASRVFTLQTGVDGGERETETRVGQELSFTSRAQRTQFMVALLPSSVANQVTWNWLGVQQVNVTWAIRSFSLGIPGWETNHSGREEVKHLGMCDSVCKGLQAFNLVTGTHSGFPICLDVMHIFTILSRILVKPLCKCSPPLELRHEEEKSGSTHLALANSLDSHFTII